MASAVVPRVRPDSTEGTAVDGPSNGPSNDSVTGYQALPAHIDLAKLDHDVIGQWRESKVFARSLEQTVSGPRWTFYEGPPTANGMPGTHHV